jgi:ketosteroid isomerase-like protein
MNPTSEHEEPAAGARATSEQRPEQRIVSLSPDGLTGASVETLLRRRIDEIAQAIRDKNLDQLMTFYDLDVEVFDVRASLNVPGAAAYRNNLESWFESFAGPIQYEVHNLRVVPGDRAAFCHYLGLVTGARPGGRSSGYWVRGTTCFERRDGEWRVTHEHISLPRP